MSSLRSLKRHLNPLNVWRAKQKVIREQAKNESQSKQEEITNPSEIGESGNIVSASESSQAS